MLAEFYNYIDVFILGEAIKLLLNRPGINYEIKLIKGDMLKLRLRLNL